MPRLILRDEQSLKRWSGGITLRSLAEHLREWSRDNELDIERPGLAEAAEEHAVQLDSVADALERGNVGTEALDDLQRFHGYIGTELRSAVRAAAPDRHP